MRAKPDPWIERAHLSRTDVAASTHPGALASRISRNTLSRPTLKITATGVDYAAREVLHFNAEGMLCRDEQYADPSAELLAERLPPDRLKGGGPLGQAI